MRTNLRGRVLAAFPRSSRGMRTKIQGDRDIDAAFTSCSAYPTLKPADHVLGRHTDMPATAQTNCSLESEGRTSRARQHARLSPRSMLP
jgi:hypothetical protein